MTDGDACAFCRIIAAYPAVSPTARGFADDDAGAGAGNVLDPDRVDPPAHVVLSTAHTVAFLDVYPLTRGHVLCCPRRHAPKLGDLTAAEAGELGAVLPLLSRALVRALLPGHADADYNVVQNNGPGAAQVVPHVHFHWVPRYPLDAYHSGTATTTAAVPTGVEATRIMFGRGQRHYRDEEESEQLARLIRRCVRDEWEKEFGSSGQGTTKGRL